jgi:2-succinyl-5-enolpyruvyl-6-hydroxy-3-cyclohexene-1-carboxylate synthase
MNDSPHRANRNTFWAHVFVEELCRGGVRAVCISPGSRSAPLTLAFAARADVEAFTIVDERGAAFFALGLAKASGRPVALVCTSGTAAANYLPAVLEAHLSRVPLVVLTADRPPLHRDVGAGQTVDQLKLYGTATRWFHEVGEPVMREADLRRLRGLAARALFESCRPPAGPVHLNFAFRKPLEPTTVPGDVPPTLAAEPAPAAGARPYSRAISSPPVAGPDVLERLAERIRAAPRGLILCGPMTFAPRLDGAQGDGAASGRAAGEGAPADGNHSEAEWPAALAILARRCGYPILAEPAAGIWCGEHDTSRILANSEAVLRVPEFRSQLTPQLVLRFGGMPTNRHVEVLLDEHPDCPLVLVNESGAWLEPTHHPLELICAEPAGFCSALAERLQHHKPRHGWLAGFWRADRLAGEALDDWFTAPPPLGLGDEYFEGRVFRELAALLPAGSVQFTASSMPVRDLAAFSPLTARATRHLVNRGANGIDGTLSSALGAAAYARRAGVPAVLVTGDLAFFHDANGLLTAKTHDLPLTVVLINNDGGGIFEFLPIAEFGAPYERHFGTPHGIDFAALCAAYGVSLSRPLDWAGFRAQVSDSLRRPGMRVIEVRTERRRNREQHRQTWEAVAARVAPAFPPGWAQR